MPVSVKSFTLFLVMVFYHCNRKAKHNFSVPSCRLDLPELETPPQAHVSEHPVPGWRCCLGRVKSWSLVEDFCYWGQALRVYSFNPRPVCPLCFLCVAEKGSFSFLIQLPTATSLLPIRTLPLKLLAQEKLSSVSFGPDILSQELKSS